MGRIGLYLLVFVGLGVGVFFVVRKTPPPIEISAVGTLGAVHTLELGRFSYDEDETREKHSISFGLKLKNHLDRAATLAVRLEDASHERITVELRGETKMLPRGSAKPSMVIKPPGAMGGFSGTVVLHCADAPGWSYTIKFEGEIARMERTGRWLTLRPMSVDLGSVRPGEKKPFVATLINEGTEEITIREWRALDRKHVRLAPGLRAGDLIAPGGEKQLSGTVLIPEHQGFWVTRILIVSDASNEERRQFQIGANIEPDFTVDPAYTKLDNVYPPRQPQFTVLVTARKGMAPFRVTDVKNLAKFFEVKSLGSDKPAAMQKVVLRVSREAPHQVVRGHAVRLVVEPPGIELEHKIFMHTHGPISAQPGALNWGTVRVGAKVEEKEVLLATFAGRKFKVTNAQSQRGKFVARVIQSSGLTPRVMVRPADGLSAGVHDDVILIETDDPEMPRLRVKVRIEYRE